MFLCVSECVFLCYSLFLSLFSMGCDAWNKWFDLIWYCVLFSSRVNSRVRVRIRFSIWLVSWYAHIFVRLQVVIVTDPSLPLRPSMNLLVVFSCFFPPQIRPQYISYMLFICSTIHNVCRHLIQVPVKCRLVRILKLSSFWFAHWRKISRQHGAQN